MSYHCFFWWFRCQFCTICWQSRQWKPDQQFCGATKIRMTLFQSMCMFYTRFSCGNIFNFHFYFHKCIVYSHGKKRAKKIQAGKIDVNEADLFDTFRVSTTIHGRYYSETHTILGRTYGVCVLQVINFWGFSGRKRDNLRSNKMYVLLSIDSLDGCIKLEAESHKTILVSHHPARI